MHNMTNNDKTQKSSDFSARANILSAISFRLPSVSIPTAASTDSPLSSPFDSDFSRPSAQRLVLVSLQLSFLQTSVSFRPLHFGFWLLNLCFWFSLSSWLRLTVTSSVLIFHFHFRCLPRYLLPDFSCIPSRFWYSHLLYVSFHPSLIRSHSCSSGAYF